MQKISNLLFAVLILPFCFLFTACNNYTIYYPQVPLDEEFNATLTDYLEVYNEAHDFTETTKNLFAVVQKNETFSDGVSRFVVYVEWRQIGHWWMYGGPYDADRSYTYLHVGDKTFVLDGDHWIKEEDSGALPYYSYESNYSNMADSDSFRYKMTSKLYLYSGGMGRELYDKYKTKTTDEYIEYICQDDETFWVSNDDYNVLLKYEYDTGLGSLEKHNATFNPGNTSVPHLTPDGTTEGATTEHVPYLNTITASMLAG